MKTRGLEDAVIDGLDAGEPVGDFIAQKEVSDQYAAKHYDRRTYTAKQVQQLEDGYQRTISMQKDDIVRLRNCNAALRAVLAKSDGELAVAKAEIERLRGFLKRILAKLSSIIEEVNDNG